MHQFNTIQLSVKGSVWPLFLTCNTENLDYLDPRFSKTLFLANFMKLSILSWMLRVNSLADPSAGVLEFGSGNFLMKPPDTSYLTIPNILSEEFSRQRYFNTFILEGCSFLFNLGYFCINIMYLFHFKSFLYEINNHFYFKSDLVPWDLNTYIHKKYIISL